MHLKVLHRQKCNYTDSQSEELICPKMQQSFLSHHPVANELPANELQK